MYFNFGMLTTKQVDALYHDGVEIKFNLKPPKTSPSEKGSYDPGTLEVSVYRLNIDSILDRDLTILHEFVHARDDRKGSRYLFGNYGKKGSDEEERVESEARETYKRRPRILEYIKLLYNIY